MLVKALRLDKGFDEAILLLHQLYLRKKQPKKSAHVFNTSADLLDLPYANRALFDQANYFFEIGEYEKAQASINSLNGEVYKTPNDAIQLLKKSIDFAVSETVQPTDIRFQLLPKPLNAFTLQYFPSISATGKLVFTIRGNRGRGQEDLYFSEYSDGIWSKPKPISSNINTARRNEGTASISADGSTLVFTACNLPKNIGSCDLYISYYNKSDWSVPVLLGKTVNSKFWDSQPALSRDGKTLYFVSNRPGGLGQEDIWVSYRGENGWSKAENLGPTVNTPYDDCSPYIYMDQKTLFFASKGKAGLGGFDLFSTKLSPEGWQESKNLGYPINNAFDQLGYSVGANSWVYYSSSDKTGKILLSRFRIPEGILPIKQPLLVSAVVLDKETLKPLSAKITVRYPADSTRLPEVTNTNPKTGGFKVFVDPNGNIKIKAPGYKAMKLDADQFNDEVLVEPLEVNKANVNFDTNSSVIREGDKNSLNKVVEFILENFEVIIEVGTHTDLVGNEEPNQRLSEARASSVYCFLVENGTPEENLTFKGYGETNPLVALINPEANPLNRRVEFKITGFLD